MKRFTQLLIVLLAILPSLCFAGTQTASSTTGTAMIAKVRVLLDEPTAKKWSDANLLQFINDGMADVAARTLSYQGTEDVTLVGNTVEYTPSTDYIAVITCIYNPATGKSIGLKKGNVRSRGSTGADDFDEPVWWYEFGGKVGFYPAPTSVTTETVTVYFAKRPGTITAGQDILTPAVFDNALMYFVTYQAFLMDGRIAEANNYMMLYMKEIDRFRSDFVEVDNETNTPTP